MAIFSVKDMTFKYPGQSNAVLKNINFEIAEGEFVIICGSSGSGKTTLLRNLKPIIAPHGSLEGEILFRGVSVSQMSQKEQCAKIGYVLQNPDSQLITDKVWHELAFGMESQGVAAERIRLRTAEMASFFNIQTWFNKDVSKLSGGQKQLLNLASVMTVQPDVLILDEPVSQLDPIAAGEFMQTLHKLNRELGTTVIITEHRLEEALSMTDKVLVLDDGKLIANGFPSNVVLELQRREHPIFEAMPAPMRAAAMLDDEGIFAVDHRGKMCLPMDVREGREWLNQVMSGIEHGIKSLPEVRKELSGARPCLEAKDVWFKYDRNGDDVIKGLFFKAYPGELLCIVGGNGTGKTTAVNLAAGIRKPYRGKINRIGKCAVLPQNPQTVFVKESVGDDLLEVMNTQDETAEQRIKQVAETTDIVHLLDMHPYDLSGGEQQRAALAKVLLTQPDILFLDEPTKGLDNFYKKKLADIIGKLKTQGIAVVMVSHDIEFCGRYADRCGMFFDGKIITENTPRTFFSGNSFYTTAANRMSRHIFENAVTAEDVVTLVKANMAREAMTAEDKAESKTIHVDSPGNNDKKRHFVLSVSNDVKPLKINNNMKNIKREKVLKKHVETEGNVAVDSNAKKNRKYMICMDIVFIALAVFTTFAGFYIFDNQKYLAVGVLITIYSMIPFFVGFERRKPKGREIVILAVMIALAVASRAAFFMVPNFKPVLAIVIIAGVALGREAGFMIGAMAAFVSNFLFGQGPWTPWQMLAMALGGYLAGLVFHRLGNKVNRWLLALFGIFTAFFLYGGIVDLWTILVMTHEPNLATAVAVYTAAVPFNLIHAVATGIFILLLAKPIISKVERVKVKYGMAVYDKFNKKGEVKYE